MKIAAIVTAYKRIEQTLATLRVIQSCTPPPDEILVHIDANEIDCEEAVQKAFPMVRVLRGDERLGPGATSWSMRRSLSLWQVLTTTHIPSIPIISNGL
jgi:GT2 family glycosyltransferase